MKINFRSNKIAFLMMYLGAASIVSVIIVVALAVTWFLWPSLKTLMDLIIYTLIAASINIATYFLNAYLERKIVESHKTEY